MEEKQSIDRVPDAVTQKRRRPALTRVMASLTGWGVLFAAGLAAVLFWGWNVFTAAGPLTQEKTVLLPSGAGRTEIAAQLEQEGIISDARVLNGASLLLGLRGSTLKPGEYAFEPGATMASVFEAISAGRVVTYKLTIPEGWTSQMALARINGNEVLAGDAVPPAAVPEGALVADTMVFRRGMTRAKLVEDMIAAQAKLLDEIWTRRTSGSPLKSKEELLTLASIVEKETGIAAERPRVAAVFLNRLKQGMRLQSDPTIIYGIAGGQGKLDRALTRADIDTKTAYNTYQIDGLPPGPIATPGRAALEAVISPAPTEDLFFVADGTGGHAFARTLEEHNANVAKWREIQQSGNMLPQAAQSVADDAAEAEPVTTVVQPELPAPAVAPAAAPQAVQGEDPALAEAAATQQAAQPVPTPQEADQSAEQATEADGQQPQPAATEAPPQPQTAALKPPRPVEKKPKPAVQAASAGTGAAARVVFVPGTVVEFDGRRVPVPKLKGKKP
jgi:UPF0755 protein